MKSAFSVLLAYIFFSLIGISAATAQEIVIKDTSGVTRSVTQVDAPSNVEFTLTDASGMPADGAEIILKNEVSGQQLHAVSSNGTVIFEGVDTGTWVVASNTTDVTFTNILVNTAYAAAGLGGAGIGGSLAAVAGGSAAVAGTTIAIVDANRGKDRELSPSS